MNEIAAQLGEVGLPAPVSELAGRDWKVLPSGANFVFAIPPGPAAGVYQRLLVLDLLGLEIRHIDPVVRETRGLRLEPLELKVAEVDADVCG